MKVEMKRCLDCKALLNKELNLCTKCGSRNLEKGFFEREAKNNVIWTHEQFNKGKNDCVPCPVCGMSITTINDIGECSSCETTVSGSDYSY